MAFGTIFSARIGHAEEDCGLHVLLLAVAICGASLILQKCSRTPERITDQFCHDLHALLVLCLASDGVPSRYSYGGSPRDVLLGSHAKFYAGTGGRRILLQ